MPTRVLYLINTLLRSGAERDLVTICNNIDRTRYLPEVWVLVGGGPLEQEIRDAGIIVRDLGMKKTGRFRFALDAGREIANAPHDLIHACLPAAAYCACWGKIRYGIRKPMIMSVLWSATKGFDQWMQRYVYPRVFDHFMVNSASAGQLVLKNGGSPDQIHIVPNGHDPTVFEAPYNRGQLRASLNIASDDQLIAYVGRLIGLKRVIDLVDAIALLRESHPKVKAVLIGEGPMHNEILQRIESRGLQNRVQLAGLRSDVPDLLRASDMFVFPSEREGLPNAVIEACFAGLPIVACDAPGVRDVVSHGKEALLAETRNPQSLAKCIATLLDDPALAKRLSEAAQQKARNEYTIEKSLDRLYELYDLAMHGRTPAAAQLASA